MKTQTKYISDRNHFIIENGMLTGFEYTHKLEELHKFLTEYLNEHKKESMLNEEPSDSEELFLSIIKYGKWDGDYYLNKEGQRLIYNAEIDTVWIHYNRFWNKFYEEFSMEYEDIKAFMKDMLLKHLKIEGKTPRYYTT